MRYARYLDESKVLDSKWSEGPSRESKKWRGKMDEVFPGWGEDDLVDSKRRVSRYV